MARGERTDLYRGLALQERGSEIVAALRAIWKIPEREALSKWSRKIHLAGDYAQTGPVTLENSKYLEWPLDLLTNDEVRQVNVCKAVQTGGTMLADMWLAHIVANEPAPTMMALQSDIEADAHRETRTLPTLKTTPATKALTEAANQRGGMIRFPHMTLYMTGAKVNAFQRKTIRWLILSELWMWDSPTKIKHNLYSQALGRVDAYQRSQNYRVLCESQAGTEGDMWERVFNAGKRYDHGWRCPQCHHEQPLAFTATMLDDEKTRAGIVFETEFDGETYDIDRATATTRLRCRKCAHEIPNTPKGWALVNDATCWVMRPEDAGKDGSNISLHWEGLVRGRWDAMVRGFLSARASQKAGIDAEMAEWMRKNRAIWWSPDMSGAGTDKIELTTTDTMTPIDDERFRFCTVDYQDGAKGDTPHVWMCLTSWDKHGNSRRMNYRRVKADEMEILKQAQEWGCTGRRVGIDGGHELLMIARWAANHGWLVMRGDNPEMFRVRVKVKGTDREEVVSRLWRQAPSVDGHRGTKEAGRTRAVCVEWSNPGVKDVLSNLMKGKGRRWEAPRDMPPEWHHQISGEQRRVVSKRDGKKVREWVRVRDNHAWDCELMALVMAMIAGIFTGGEGAKDGGDGSEGGGDEE